MPTKGRGTTSGLDEGGGGPEVQELAEEVQAVRAEEDEERRQPVQEVSHEDLPPENEESPGMSDSSGLFIGVVERRLVRR